MALHVKNIQKVIVFNQKHFEKMVEALRTAAGVQNYDLSILCTDTPYMNQVNKPGQKDRKSITSTGSKLSSPYSEKSKYWSTSIACSKVQENLGDIILDLPAIFDKSRKEDVNLYTSLALMTTKGLCQLLGCQDNSEMCAKEMDILSKYHQLLGIHHEPIRTFDPTTLNIQKAAAQ